MTRTDELFVFVGAGASFSAPTSLPLFADIRDHILVQFRLDEYGPDGDDALRRVATGLFPEPFLLLLARAGVPMQKWLGQVFSQTEPNAVHATVAELAVKGASVWTVNFDDGIERAVAGGLSVAAWPAPPDPGADLYKAHGSAGQRLIVDADQVRSGLDPAWRSSLADAVVGKTVVFIGYRGRDLDFQPVWDDVLDRAVQVLWFDFQGDDPESRAEQERKRALLRTVDRDGRLAFPPPEPPPRADARPNPSWDFVAWARREGLADPPAELVAQLHERPVRRPLPPIPMAGSALISATIRQIMGDVAGARRTYVHAIVRGPDRWPALRQLAALTVNHGSRVVAALLVVNTFVPPIGRLKRLRRKLHRARVNILFNTGRHRAVLQATRRISEDLVSTTTILRASALRMVGDLDEAAAEAKSALRQARHENHGYRIANAAFQLTFALMWAGRLDEARAALDEDLRPHAEITANRWVAWSDALNAALEIHAKRGNEALDACEDAIKRFRAEALVDGAVAAMTIRLTALRCAGRPDEYWSARRELIDLLERPIGTYYARGSRFTSEAIAAETGEFLRCWSIDHAEARRHFDLATSSAHAVHTALGHLGLAALDAEAGQFADAASHTAIARDAGSQHHMRLVQARAAELDDAIQDRRSTRPSEFFLP